MWQSRTKIDLVIEVWEKLDCESVGAVEIKAIETVVADVFGEQAVDSPMVIARLLADEGAELRHSELMDLYVERASEQVYDPVFADTRSIDDLNTAASLLQRAENQRLENLGDLNHAAFVAAKQRLIYLKE